MPKVPMVRQDDWNGVQLPTVMSADAAPLARGAQSLARGVADMGRAFAAVGDVVGRVRERKIQEEETALVDSWRAAQIRTWDGGPGDGPGAEPVRGVKDWGEGDGSATDAMRAAWQTWRDDPDGPYAKASPEARRRADRVLMADTARAFSLAAQKDVALGEARRRTAAEASLATAERAASMYARDDALFTGAAADAADQAARLKLGRLIANPGEADPEKLVFKTDGGAALYAAVRADALDRLRHGRARTLARDAGVAGNEPDAASGIAAAARVAETLPPDLRADALAELETVRAKRLDGMLGLARAERDLDKRERLADAALAAAKSYGAGGKLLGAVTEEAGRIRESAQREENRLALAALAEGRPYEPGDNPRMLEALKTAKPKHEAALKKERDAAASAANAALSAKYQEFRAGEKYHSTLLRAGIRIDPATGEAVPMDENEQHAYNLDLLEGGQIGPDAFRKNESEIRKAAAPAARSRSARLAADICAAVGADIALLSKKDADPEEKLGKFTVTETKREMVPVMETVTGYRQGLISGGRPTTERYTVERDTGRREERATVATRKRELLASDLQKIIKIAEMAHDARGLKVDLDGLPATPPEQMDPELFIRRIIGDLKRRQLSVDIDAALDGLADAIVERNAARSARTGRALAASPAWSFGAGKEEGADAGREDAADDDEDYTEE
jgi:hypothetical protein